MPWWGWVIFGAFLLGSELFIVDVAFYLVFVGIAAIATGLVVLAGVGLEPWAQWFVFSAVAIVSMVSFRKRLYDKLRGGGADYNGGLTGSVLRLEERLAPGASCRQTYRGTTWTVTNQGAVALDSGVSVVVERVEGLSLMVMPTE